MSSEDPTVSDLQQSLRHLYEAHTSLETAGAPLITARDSTSNGTMRDKLSIAIHRLESLQQEIDYTAEDIIAVLPDTEKHASDVVQSWNEHLGSSHS